MMWVINYTNILTFIALTYPSHFPTTCDLINLLPLHPYLFFSIFIAQQCELQVLFSLSIFFSLSLLYSSFYCFLSSLYSSLIYCFLLNFLFSMTFKIFFCHHSFIYLVLISFLLLPINFKLYIIIKKSTINVYVCVNFYII